MALSLCQTKNVMCPQKPEQMAFVPNKQMVSEQRKPAPVQHKSTKILPIHHHLTSLNDLYNSYADIKIFQPPCQMTLANLKSSIRFLNETSMTLWDYAL